MKLKDFIVLYRGNMTIMWYVILTFKNGVRDIWPSTLAMEQYGEVNVLNWELFIKIKNKKDWNINVNISIDCEYEE